MNCWICGYRLDGASCRMSTWARGGSAYDAYHSDVRAIQLYEIAREQKPRDIVT